MKTIHDQVVIANAPAVPGLVFRHFRGEQDYPHMAALIAACKVADGVERSTTVKDISNTYRHLENCDPQTDMLFAEVDEHVIAYGRLWWTDQVDGSRLYFPFGFVHPDWRGKGLGAAMWDAAEARCFQIAAGHPKEMPKFLQTEFHQPVGKSTLWILTAQLGQFLGMLAFGLVADRWGRRPVLIFSLLGTVVSFVMLALAQSLAMLFAARIVDGVSCSIVELMALMLSKTLRLSSASRSTPYKSGMRCKKR